MRAWMLYRGVHATIGRTPLVELRRIGDNGVRLLAKLELRNPGGSVKDRIAAAMIEDAERRGVLRPAATIVEATSGNTGIALAFVAATKGYTLHVTMPERDVEGALTLLRYLGAQVVLTPGALMREAVERAEAMRREIPGAVALDQFSNPANPEAHRETTGREIWEDTAGEIDVFVAGVGTGGTITGVGEVLKARKPGVRVVAVEPASAAVLSGRRAAQPHDPGDRRRLRPAALEPRGHRRGGRRSATTRRSPTPGAWRGRRGSRPASRRGRRWRRRCAWPRRPENEGKTIVFMVCDGGERYIHGPLVNELLGASGT